MNSMKKRKLKKRIWMIPLCVVTLLAVGFFLYVVSVYGSEDHVLNMQKMKDGDAYLPDTAVRQVIEGGNHAQFGNYGAQDGDGRATISAEDQQRQTAALIMQNK